MEKDCNAQVESNTRMVRLEPTTRSTIIRVFSVEIYPPVEFTLVGTSSFKFKRLRRSEHLNVVVASLVQVTVNVYI